MTNPTRRLLLKLPSQNSLSDAPDFWPVLPGAEPISEADHTGAILVSEMRGVWIERNECGLRWDVSFVRKDGMQNRGGTDYWYRVGRKGWQLKMAKARAAAARVLTQVLL